MCRAWPAPRTLRTSSVSYGFRTSASRRLQRRQRRVAHHARRRALPGPPFELPLAPARPACRARRSCRSRRRARRAAARVSAGCRPGRRPAMPVNGPSGSGDSSHVRRGADRRGVDEHIPRARARRPVGDVAPVDAPRHVARARAARARRSRPARRPRAAPRPRRVPRRRRRDRRAQALRRATLDCSGARKPATSVLQAAQPSAAAAQRVDRADAPAHRVGSIGALERVDLEGRGHARAVECRARRQTPGSRRSPPPQAADTRHRCRAARNAALCMAGESECMTGRPTTP